MAIYTVTISVDRAGYDVSIEFENGGRQIIQGFKTEDEAKAWVAEDERVMGPRRRGADN